MNYIWDTIAVHYPMPLHLQETFEYLGYKVGNFPIRETFANKIISLQINPYVRNVKIKYISEYLTKSLLYNSVK